MLAFVCVCKRGRKRGTSENVKDAVFSVFLLTGKIASIKILAFIANGTMTNEMEKEGTLMAYDNCRILVVRGPPMKVNITIPNTILNTHVTKFQ